MIPLLIGHLDSEVSLLLDHLEVLTTPARPVLHAPERLSWTHPPSTSTLVILVGMAQEELMVALGKLGVPGGPRRILVHAEQSSSGLRLACARYGASGPFRMSELREMDWAALSDPGGGRSPDSTGSHGSVAGTEFRFLRDLNHFLRNRLCTLEQVFAVAADDLTDPYHMTITLPRIEREIRRIEDTLERSLTMVSPLPPAEFSVDIAAVLPRIAERVRVNSARPVAFRLEAPPSPVRVRGHEELAEIAFVEVLRNAAEHSGQGEERGLVDIGIQCGEDAPVRVTVEHDGPAILPENREKVFGAFVTDGERSTGLGLPIARRMMNHMGGRLDLVESPEGKLLYRFEFPALHSASKETSPQGSG